MSDPKTEAKPAAAPEQVTMKQVLDLIPAAIAAAVAASKNQAPAAAAPRTNVAQPKCTDCKQEARACKGQHIQMVVYPERYPQHADYFPGVKINGVTYLSNDGGHRITVPAEAEATIMGIVATFEQNEQDMQLGRKAVRHSGVVSPNGSSFQPANAAWR